MTSPLYDYPSLERRGACLLPFLNNDGQSEFGEQTNHTQCTTHAGNKKHCSAAVIVPELKQTEDLLALEMTTLSAEERAIAQEDVHCVGKEPNETPDLIQKSLAEFEQALRTQHATCPIYKLAVDQNRAFVEDTAFRLKFLRANSYNVDESVHQMLDLLHHKEKYFGKDNVARDIVMSDLTDEEVDLMQCIHHIQEDRDRMGRVILHVMGWDKHLRCAHGLDTLIRAVYYTCWHVVTAIPDAQSKGVALIFDHAFFQLTGMDFLKEFLPFFNSLPLRSCVMHIRLEKSSGGYNPGLIDEQLCFFLKGLPQYIRARACIHHGSSMEIQCKLRRHGIPTDTFPIDQDGNIRDDIRNLWFEKHLQKTNQTVLFQRTDAQEMNLDLGQFLSDISEGGLMDQLELDDEIFLDQIQAPREEADKDGGENEDGEDESSSRNGNLHLAAGINPNERDVLFGKGHHMQTHPGNIRFRDFVQQHRDEYDSVPRHMKGVTSMILFQNLHDSGVRFLEKSESGEWVESNIADARKKITQVCRDLRKRKQRKRKRVDDERLAKKQQLSQME